MDAPGLSASEFLAPDTPVPRRAGGAVSGNVVHAAITSAMRDGIMGYLLEAVAGLSDWPGMVNLRRRKHPGMLEAVGDGRADVAAALVAAHIDGFHRERVPPSDRVGQADRDRQHERG